MASTVQEAIAILESGDSIVYPTSTLPGLGCLPITGSLDKLFELKNRTYDKPVSLGVANLSQAENLVEIPRLAEEILAAFPLGSLTLILPAKQRVDERLGGARIAIRVFAHPVAIEISQLVGPLSATSANPSEELPISDVILSAASLGLPESHAVLGNCPGGEPSTIISIEQSGNSAWSGIVMREGVIPADDVARWLTMRPA